MIVSTEPMEGAMVIGTGTEGTLIDPDTAGQVRSRFKNELKTRGWLTSAEVKSHYTALFSRLWSDVD